MGCCLPSPPTHRHLQPQRQDPHGVQVIHTTANHLLWDPASRQWVQAAKLRKGEHLKTPDGTVAVADGGITPAVHDGSMWDLTVPGNNDHDFYVVAGDTAVLVHNNNDSCGANIISNADGFDNSHELSKAAPGDVYSGVYDPESGTFYAHLSLDEKDPANFPNAVLSQGGRGEVNFWHFQGSRSTVGFTMFFEEDGVSVDWFSRSVNRRNFGDPVVPLAQRQDIMDAIASVTGMRVWSR